MDAPFLEHQVRHLVDQLVGPADFFERILTIDPYPGPFLRQHSPPDLAAALDVARSLRDQGVLDRVLVSPRDAVDVAAINHRWFDLDVAATHSMQGIPVAPQLWAFDQVTTRYVLQCDVDVLVGRHDRGHDYLAEMIDACADSSVVCVAFNIPHDPASAARPYEAPAGEYKPEVRCGLLDLQRLRAAAPLPNRVEAGQLAEPWYRSLQHHQRRAGLRTVRGGSPRTFYIHPLNDLKAFPDELARVRDLVDQALVPSSCWDRWDVGIDTADWRYPARAEQLIILARGRDTPAWKIDRFAAGLAMQQDQTFGIIVIDDASTDQRSSRHLRDRLRFLGSRLTLVRHARHHGHMLNNRFAIRELCVSADSCIVIVDLDDALADPNAVGSLRSKFESGHDVVLAAPFRPEKPTKVYQPDFRDPRGAAGADVWIHLRAFAKRLFDQVPDDALMLNGKWVPQCEDYAIMIPIVELAKAPTYVPEYWYWHERTTGGGAEGRARRDAIIEQILAKPRRSP